MDRIILLFDAHKLDISDEFSEVIRALKNHEDKMRVVLNKADQINTQQLMRVYGALMWSLGKIINTPEVTYYLIYFNKDVSEIAPYSLYSSLHYFPYMLHYFPTIKSNSILGVGCHIRCRYF